MKFSTTKTIVLEEFPKEQRAWLPKLLNPLNQFLEQVYKSLVNGLTLRDNMKSQISEIKIGVAQIYPIKLAWNVNEKPTSCSLGYLAEDISSFALLPVHSFQWIFNQGQIEIYLIGLDPNKAYKATIKTLV